MNKTERVRFWNTFFRHGRTHAEELFLAIHKRKAKGISWSPLGGTLQRMEFQALAMLEHCCLAAEARTNHLIDELREDETIDDTKANELKLTPIGERWFKLPKLAGKTANPSKPPHQVITQITSLRNDLFHANFDQLRKRLHGLARPKVFTEFVEAMEDLNVLLGRHPSPDPKILAIGRFE